MRINESHDKMRIVRKPIKLALNVYHSLVVIPLVLSLTGCNLFDSSHVIAQLQDELGDLLPEYINHSFMLPESTQYNVTWSASVGDIISNEYHYVTTYADQTIELKATVNYGFSKIETTFTVPLIAPDSGFVVSELDIDLLGNNYWQIDRYAYSPAAITLETQHNGVPITEFDATPVEIRGRGNSTWWVYDKKPYRLHFDEDISLLGMKPAKNYVLLAEHADRSFVRNLMTQKLAQLMEHIPYALEMRFVQLSFNGDYQGLYTLFEQVELNNTRYDVDSNLANDDAGFLMELDWRQTVPESTSIEGIDYIVINDFPYVFQEPEMNDNGFEQRHIDYMTQWIENMELSLLIRQNYDRYFDVDNWIDYFLIQELVKNVDVGWSSFFFVKPSGGKITLGPLWDFDFAYGNADYIPSGPTGFWGFVNYKNKWFTMMMEVPSLRQRFVDRFNEIKDTILPQWQALLPQLKVNLNDDAARNFERWPILDTYLWPTPWQVLQANSHTKQINYIRDYLSDRIEWMDNTLNSNSFLTADYTN